MLDTLQDIQNNGIVNRFKEIAASYGIYGMYVNWQPGGLNDGGVYFVCGLDKNKVLSKDIDMYKTLEAQKRSKGYICTDVAVLKISGEHPFMLHCNLINYCHKLDILQKVYGYLNKPIPSRISNEMLETLRMTWRNFTDEKKSESLRKEYEKMLTFAVSVQAEGSKKGDPNYKKQQYLLNGYYDTGKSKLYNWFKRYFVKHKNQVTLTHLLAQVNRINNAKITYRNYDKVKKALNERPDILYCFSEVRGDVLEVADNEGFGSKDKNDKRFYTLYYPSIYTKDIEEIIQKINYPEEFNRTLDDVDPHNYGTEHLIIPIEYFQIFKNRCDESGIKFCIDRTAHNTVNGGIAIAFSTANSLKAYNYLMGIIKVSENYRLKDPVPQRTISSNDSLDKKIEELKSAGFKEVDPQNINSHVSIEER